MKRTCIRNGHRLPPVDTLPGWLTAPERGQPGLDLRGAVHRPAGRSAVVPLRVTKLTLVVRRVRTRS